MEEQLKASSFSQSRFCKEFSPCRCDLGDNFLVSPKEDKTNAILDTLERNLFIQYYGCLWILGLNSLTECVEES